MVACCRSRGHGCLGRPDHSTALPRRCATRHRFSHHRRPLDLASTISVPPGVYLLASATSFPAEALRLQPGRAPPSPTTPFPSAPWPCRQTRERDLTRLREGLAAVAATVARGHPQTTPASIARRVARLFGNRDAARSF